MKIEDFLDLKLVLKIDQLGGITSKSLNKLIKPACKVVKFLTKTRSKVHKLLTYNKIMGDSIYENRQRKAINKKL